MNAQFSQAKVANGILNAVQSDRLAFMLERTKKNSAPRWSPSVAVRAASPAGEVSQKSELIKSLV
ncbi:hypothetical protein CDG76_28310 [Nostoc sp. 'Peltigera membranacea cyanobiont' 210A]|uniref:hypothetical protein n=1 Tax=Nostoc sp. 'Peltigera membranacea cyanobiont' 210A TaxID=2014529 RepID=UPI000B95937F|nr:hypothetical protein [Nostoc sp. 'Peltigera membranacea cyanobiont' 210A]OYD91157.1 hypothetical protein CDG76_28310 [Nostoc sp. 'Peltigera membranacea cyanobiont' 210A]